MHVIDEYRAYPETDIDIERETVRAIIKKGQTFLMLYSGVLKDYTFPGGGIEQNETHQEALKREVLEETGMHVQGGRYIGTYIEYVYDFHDRSKKLKRTNHYYVLTPGPIESQQLTQEEKTYEMTPIWIKGEDAMKVNQKMIEKKSLRRDPYWLLKELKILSYIKEMFMRNFEIIDAYKSLHPVIPQRQTTHSAGYDLASIEEVVIKPGEIVLIKTGLKVNIPDNEVLFIYPRSSLGIKKGLMMSNGVGVVDADYYNNARNEGHLMIPLYNFSKKAARISKGERVAQGVFQTYLKTVDDAPVDSVRLGGFGSSTKR